MSNNTNTPADPPPPPFIDQIYDQLKQVFGGIAEDQLFVMEFPGRPLAQGTYQYPGAGTVDGETLRPTSVAQEEFLLADGIIPLGDIVGGPTGEKLSETWQYIINNLIPIPESNGTLQAAQDAARLWLNDLVDFQGGKVKRIDVYHTLNQAYDNALKAFNELVESKKPKPGAPASDFETFNEWYVNQQPAKDDIEDLHSQLLAQVDVSGVKARITILDTKAADGILEDARVTLRDSEKLALSGSGKVYPVDFTPRDWAKGLSTNFLPEDLTQDPDSLEQQKLSLESSRDNLLETRRLLVDSQTGNITKLQADKDAAETAYQNAQSALISQYTDAVADIAKIYLKKKYPNDNIPDNAKASDDFTAIKNDVNSEVTTKLGKPPLSDDDINKLVKLQKATILAQQNLTTTSKNLVLLQEALANAQSTDAKQSLAVLDGQIKSLTTQINTIDNSINRVLNHPVRVLPDGTSPPVQLIPPSRTSVSYFQDVIIKSTASSQSHSSSLMSGASHTSWSVDLIFGSASGNSDSQYSNFNNTVKAKNTSINIGFKAMKVVMDRPWFEPTLFQLTSGMSRVSPGPLISTGPPTRPDPFNGGTWNKNLSDTQKASLLPAYTIAFIVAKDITIHIQCEESVANEMHNVLSKSNTIGGGVFCFSASHSDASSSDTQSFGSQASSQGLILRITSPQIIGWYLQCVPKDESQRLQ
ncbi:hypothetical protein BC936DRAFT_137781 [Jimgerdemannia flammicorona]|uniref:Uncharacterized protein n=1 Tax=Jimgerdemannia flammicorona TaxID=994334 RepID=A0A433DIU0_9FUNG|nr:hypothetical protein BC936DRAFT_137781 [Jimgerdemannia flammicorona]